MSFQQREVLRTFLRKPEVLLTYDVFTDNPDIFNPKKHYKDAYITLGKLIPTVHKILRDAIGEPCIVNTPKEGWTLKIE